MPDKKMYYFRLSEEDVIKVKEFRNKKIEEGFDKHLIDTEIAFLGMSAFDKKYAGKIPPKTHKK